MIVLYGSKFWKEILNFDALVKHGTIDEEIEAVSVRRRSRNRAGILQEQLTKYFLEPEKPMPEPAPETPQIAKSRV